MANDLHDSRWPNGRTPGQFAERHAAGGFNPADMRLKALAAISLSASNQLDPLLQLALDGLPAMHRNGIFGHTLRGLHSTSGWNTRLEGESIRYAAMVALGLSRVSDEVQRRVLGFGNAIDLARMTAQRAEASQDIGALAVAAWATVEVSGDRPSALFLKLRDYLAADVPIATVACSWALTAAVAAWGWGPAIEVAHLARRKLLSGWSGSGIFPHVLPSTSAGWVRGHIGSFADQVYPIQALARFHVVTNNREAFTIAETCAETICAHQGPQGQWWWHYDARTGQVTEGYPVYSVHQHAMAPMVLHELHQAGGKDRLSAIVKGLHWIYVHPETSAQLIDAEQGVIWRKVARREPGKAVRGAAAMTTAFFPGLRFPRLVNYIFPPIRVDYECRPYELGWLLYAWLSSDVVTELALQAGTENNQKAREG
ncbi:hypothetical protein [Rhizobium grahamii]|uniref:Uncharacterized protein n=1 Tax=Rhizobium grahamii CCGE 502 TaxID=990285 RepID=S3H8N6_9HYPH|nr:hypothetical protein [Rhizobium grahamii]EPE94964.1 hypothetical protein RGCCGE502_27603 [Rhizobium grahamii CCGE 502]